MEAKFDQTAEAAFMTIRRNADIFINLLILMLVSGMDELNLKSIGFLKEALFLDVSDEEASLAFRGVILEAR
jgi:hypothetical protein